RCVRLRVPRADRRGLAGRDEGPGGRRRHHRPSGPGLGDPARAPRDADRQLRVRRPDRVRPDPDVAARLVARALPHPDAVPRSLRLGEPARFRALDDAPHRPRRAADRAYERAATRPLGHVTRGDRMSDQPLLALRGVTMTFGGLTVIDDLDLEVVRGEIVSVIGPNGAGKTTLFNLVSGLYDPDSGEIEFEGRSIVGLPPYRITKLGIARTFQTLRLFLNMTVLENVMASQYGRTHANVLQSILRTPASRPPHPAIVPLARD